MTLRTVDFNGIREFLLLVSLGPVQQGKAFSSLTQSMVSRSTRRCIVPALLFHRPIASALPVRSDM